MLYMHNYALFMHICQVNFMNVILNVEISASQNRAGFLLYFFDYNITIPFFGGVQRF